MILNYFLRHLHGSLFTVPVFLFPYLHSPFIPRSFLFSFMCYATCNITCHHQFLTSSVYSYNFISFTFLTIHYLKLYIVLLHYLYYFMVTFISSEHYFLFHIISLHNTYTAFHRFIISYIRSNDMLFIWYLLYITLFFANHFIYFYKWLHNFTF